jgi:hypothetical protein
LGFVFDRHQNKNQKQNNAMAAIKQEKGVKSEAVLLIKEEDGQRRIIKKGLQKKEVEVPSRLTFDAIDARYLFFEMVMGSIHSQMKKSYSKFKPVRAKVVVSEKFFLMAFGSLRASFNAAEDVVPHHWQSKTFPSCCEGEKIVGIITSVMYFQFHILMSFRSKLFGKHPFIRRNTQQCPHSFHLVLVVLRQFCVTLL